MKPFPTKFIIGISSKNHKFVQLKFRKCGKPLIETSIIWFDRKDT